MSVVKRERACTTCKQVFINPESLRIHKYRDGSCRKQEALEAAGFIKTERGWKSSRLVRSV